MAVLLYATEVASEQVSYVAQRVQTIAAGDVASLFRFVCPVEGVAVEDGGIDDGGQRSPGVEPLDAIADLTGALAEALWGLTRNGHPTELGEEHLLIVLVHVCAEEDADSPGSLDPVCAAIDAIEQIVSRLSAGGDDVSIGHPLAARIQILPWIFARSLPKVWPECLLMIRPLVSDYNPLPLAHAPRLRDSDPRGWEAELRDCLLGDLMWLLPASMAVSGPLDDALLTSRAAGRSRSQVITTTVSRLVWDLDDHVVRQALQLMPPRQAEPARAKAKPVGDRVACDDAVPVGEEGTFEDRVRLALHVPDYPLDLGSDTARIRAELLPANYGPMRSTWPRYRDEQWPVLAPPLALAEIAPKIVERLERVERRALSDGLDAAHDDQLAAVRQVRRSIAEMVRAAASNAGSPSERVLRQLEILSSAEHALETILQDDSPPVIQGAEAAARQSSTWVEQERVLAARGLDYPSQGAQWAEFFGIVAVALAVALATLPTLIVPIVAMVLGVVVGGLVLWMRGRQWARYRAQWDELFKEVHRSIPEYVTGVRDVVRQRLYEARLASLGNIRSSIYVARRSLLSDSEALGLIAARRTEALNRREHRTDLGQATVLDRRGIVAMEAASSDEALSSSELAKILDERGLLDAAPAIEGVPQPLTVEQFDAALADAVRIGNKRLVQKGDGEQVATAVRRVARLGWAPPSPSIMAADEFQGRPTDRCYLLVGRRVVDACGEHLATDPHRYLGDQWEGRPEPRIWLQGSEQPLPGLASDSVLAVWLRLTDVAVAVSPTPPEVEQP